MTRGGTVWMALGLGLALGCGVGDEAGGEAVASTPGLSTRTPSGVGVTLDYGPNPLQVGPVDMVIQLDRPLSAGQSVTLDIVSPEMPSHGVLRFPVEATADPARYTARPDMPMEGHWLLYVNLDYGADAAEFELDVAVGDGMESHAGHGDHAPENDG